MSQIDDVRFVGREIAGDSTEIENTSSLKLWSIMQLFDALPWMNLAAYVFMIIMNILSSMAVFNG